MIPTLYDSDVTKLKNGGLGKGKLAEATRCVVHEELNGDFSLELDYPVNGAYYSDLVDGGMIGAHFPFPADYLYDRGVTDIKEQWFDVVGHDMSIEGIDTIKALHISRRLANYVCIPNYINSWASITGNMYPTDTGGIRWSINGSISGGFRLTTPKSALSCLIGESESVVNDLGGDAMFYTKRDYLDSQSRLGVYFRQLYPKRGGDFGAQIRFGINMLSLDHTRDKIGAYNAVVPFWENNGSFTYVTGSIVQPTTPISPVVAVPLDLSNDFDSQPTEAQMVQAARNHLDTLQPWLGTSTIKVDFLNDKDIDVNAVAINLGDTIHVYWGDADIATDLRVVAYDYDVLAERYISLELGTPQSQFVAVTGESYAGASGGGGGNVASVDFTSQCTFPKGTPAHVSAVALGDLAVISYQGPSLSTYAAQDVLVRVPAEYAFNVTAYGQQFNLCTFNTQGVGTVMIGNNAGRDIILNGKPTTSGNVRCYFQIIYTIGS